MIHLNKLSLSNLQKLGAGTYGVVYKSKDNKSVYKIYKNKIKNFSGNFVKNPSIELNKNRFKTIKNKKMKLKHTDLLDDLISIGNEICGIKMKYYDGKTISDLYKYNINKKVSLCKKMIHNAKELTNHFIYPLDFNHQNIMEVNSSIRFIDLDDEHTKYRDEYNKLDELFSIFSLNKSIKEFITNNNSFPYHRDFKNKLTKFNKNKATTYTDINDLLISASNNTNLFFIPLYTKLNDRILNYLKTFSSKVILVCNDNNINYSDIIVTINKYNDKKVFIHDIILESEIEDYLNHYNSNNISIYKNENIKRY